MWLAQSKQLTLNMKILYQDAHLIVLDKPAGLSVLPDGWEKDSQFLVKLLEEQYEKIYIVHRLDKITSGAMVFARDAETHRALNIQFENHEAQKTYHAIVEGNPKWEEKVAKHPLRANVGHKHRTMVDDKRGKPSETRFRVIKRYQEAALVEAKPMTGRTHQIRVHAYAMGHPLVEDILYGSRDRYGIPRPMLHAQSLSFTHPATNERVKFSAPRPADFEDALKIIGAIY
ncbi:MAG TPA: RluA family pseudouridine synthase [Anaerolineales bacterium]|nr:RluA family pseudouridine synthase [Anaerolineales bacterium]